MGFADATIASLKYTRSLRRKASFFKTPKPVTLSNENYEALYIAEKVMEINPKEKKMLSEKRAQITRRERLRDVFFLGIGLILLVWVFWNFSF